MFALEGQQAAQSIPTIFPFLVITTIQGPPQSGPPYDLSFVLACCVARDSLGSPINPLFGLVSNIGVREKGLGNWALNFESPMVISAGTLDLHSHSLYQQIIMPYMAI